MPCRFVPADTLSVSSVFAGRSGRASMRGSSGRRSSMCSWEPGLTRTFTTLPAGKTLYVLPGPIRANSLTWIRVTDGTVAGWGVQDHVAPYGIRNVP